MMFQTSYLQGRLLNGKPVKRVNIKNGKKVINR